MTSGVNRPLQERGKDYPWRADIDPQVHLDSSNSRSSHRRQSWSFISFRYDDHALNASPRTMP
jgi:hypothetical protein